MRGSKLKRGKPSESRSEAGRGVGEEVCFNFFELVSHIVKAMQPLFQYEDPSKSDLGKDQQPSALHSHHSKSKEHKCLEVLWLLADLFSQQFAPCVRLYCPPAKLSSGRFQCGCNSISFLHGLKVDMSKLERMAGVKLLNVFRTFFCQQM